MAIFNAGESDISTITFKERKKYKENFKIDGYSFLDTWYENPFYSKLNEKFEPVYLDYDPQVENLTTFGPEAPDIKMAPYLAKAFLTFVEEYSTIVENTNIGYPVFLGNLTPVSSHVSFESVFSSYINYLSLKLVTIIKAESDKYTFQEFLERVVYHSLGSSNYYPLTRSGFLMSKFCPVGVTGASLELTSLPPNLDSNKSRLFEDPAFKCYLDFSREQGLIVDKNLPWRLYADFNNSKMQEHISTSERSSTEHLNRFYRTKPAFDDYSSLFEMLLELYSDYLGQGQAAYDGIIILLKSFEEEHLTPEEGILKLLLRVRMLEMNMRMSKYDEKLSILLDYHRVYSVKYESRGKNRLDPALGKLLNMASEHYRSIFENRNIDSYKPTTIKDYY